MANKPLAFFIPQNQKKRLLVRKIKNSLVMLLSLGMHKSIFTDY